LGLLHAFATIHVQEPSLLVVQSAELPPFGLAHTEKKY
jgi:hypothetical protein